MANGRGPFPPDDRDWTTRRELPPIGRSGAANGGHAVHPPQQHQQQRSSVRIDAPPMANGVHGEFVRSHKLGRSRLGYMGCSHAGTRAMWGLGRCVRSCLSVFASTSHSGAVRSPAELRQPTNTCRSSCATPCYATQSLSHHLCVVLCPDGRPISPQGSSVSAASTGRSNRATVGTASLAAPSELGSLADDDQHDQRVLTEVRRGSAFPQLMTRSSLA